VCSKGFSYLVEILIKEMDGGYVFLSLLCLVMCHTLLHRSQVVPLWWLPLELLLLQAKPMETGTPIIILSQCLPV
jgi:hypothetical protein